MLICTRNRPAKLKRAVESVLANGFGDFELIVVDQSTDRATRDALAAIADRRLRYIATDTVGVALSRNIAIREAAADLVTFTDDDCVCDSGWLDAIRDEFRADQAALGVYGRVVPYGRQSEGGWDCLAVAGNLVCPAINQSTARLVVDGPALPHLALGGGNNMSFRKKVFARLGLFNEMLGPGSRIGTGEDTELSYRLLAHRCRLVYSPAPLVEHDNWLDQGQFATMMKVSMRVQAAVFLAYALRGDGFATRHLARTTLLLAANRMGVGSSLAGLYHFATGVPWGVRLLLTPAPRLADEEIGVRETRASAGAHADRGRLS